MGSPLPLAARTMTPPGGSGVAADTPPRRSAALHTGSMCQGQQVIPSALRGAP